ncbi:MAG: hypothetical protein U9N53_09490, partial [Bacteroidota bacterium]|nr:hypothetical protein [Bacteroidota bacterium]
MLRISKNKGIPFLFIFILILILGKLTFSNLYDYLTKEIQVNSKILVLEGWLPSNAVEEAAKVFIQDEYQYLIVVGSNYRIDPTICKNTPDRTRKTSEYRLNKNGYLKVNPKWLDKLTITDSIYTVIITAKGSEVMRVTAFFYLVINNKIIGKSFTTKEYLNYPFTWHNNQKSITNLYI